MKMLSFQSHDQIMHVKKILNEDDERFNYLLSLLKKWMDCHAFLPKNYDKQMLPVYLRNCKYNLEKTKQKLELYFIYKKRYFEIFCFNKFNDMEKKALDNFYIFEASKLTPEGYQVVFGGFRSPDTTECDMNVVNKILALYGIYKSNLEVILCGVIIVINFENLSPSIVSGILNPFFKRLLEMVQNIYPFRIGGIYITFLPKFAVPIANMVKMIFNENIRSRIYFEASNEKMQKNIPMYCRPKEFGGIDGTINENSAKLMQQLMLAEPWFAKQEKIKIVGEIPKDLYKPSGIDDNSGTQGSFRKLNID